MLTRDQIRQLIQALLAGQGSCTQQDAEAAAAWALEIVFLRQALDLVFDGTCVLRLDEGTVYVSAPQSPPTPAAAG